MTFLVTMRGDEALIAIAHRLRDSIRHGDIVCRIGGDEFVTLLQGLQTLDAVNQICSRIKTVMHKPFILHDQTITLSASVGVSLYPVNATELSELLNYADQALYRLKRSQKGGWAWFNTPEII